MVCVKFGRFQKPRFSICFVTETPHTISNSHVHPLQHVLPAVTVPKTLGVVFYALGILLLSFAICTGPFGTLSKFYFQQNTSPYISHGTGTIMTPNDTGGIYNRSRPFSVL
jgi:hypothetical protein